MAKKDKIRETLVKPMRSDLTPDQVEALFADVDETGHTNASRARKEHGRRRANKAAVEIDPLSGDDPSGSSVSKVISRTAMFLLLSVLLGVILAQVSCGVARRLGTAKLGQSVNVKTVATALRNGVEWGNGFTQFPQEYSVQEADESTGRIEVTVVDTSSSDAIACLSNSQIQGSALAVNALVNPRINKVIYHVNVHRAEDGSIQRQGAFGFLRPTGQVKQFATFIWTKGVTQSGGITFNCQITGLDAETAKELRDKLTTQNGLLDAIVSGSTTGAATTDTAVTDVAATGAVATSPAATTATETSVATDPAAVE